MTDIIKSRSAQCTRVDFLHNGVQPHVPLITVPVTIGAAGELLTVIGRFVLSDRPDGTPTPTAASPATPCARTGVYVAVGVGLPAA